MAGSSLLTLIDDIASLLDDVSVMTKVAAKKTAGVLGDDLALNAQQVAGVNADRELPVVWAVAKGSALNKVILVPTALLISAFAPWAITPLLMAGGLYLCFEGVEKLAHKFLHSEAEDEAAHAEKLRALNNEAVDMVAFEKEKIKGAILTDFVLSAEIIVIALGTVKDVPLSSQVSVLIAIAAIMTVGVYALVAGIVKLDDIGLHLLKSTAADAWSSAKRSVGRALLLFAPLLMKTLSVVGTAAMFMVGGGILVHGVHALYAMQEQITELAHGVPGIGGVLAAIAPVTFDAIAGVIAGALALAVVLLGTSVFKKLKKSPS